MGEAPEQIESDAVMARGSIGDINGDALKLWAALVISGAALVVGAAALAFAVYLRDNELKTWATGLISLVVGAAIGFAFSSKGA